MGKWGKPLLVIGAGPKAAAIAAKAKILRELRHPAPEVWVIDRREACANWIGKHGFTSGAQELGTPPEKDVGFPYNVDLRDEEVTKLLFSRYSWSSYLNFEVYGYGDWIDKGRPHPPHRAWAHYLNWVIEATADRIIIGECDLETINEEWVARIREAGCGAWTAAFSGVVVTGPGTPKKPFPIPEHPRIFYGDDFWVRFSSDYYLKGSDLPVVVIGGGETAASIATYLVDELKEPKSRTIIMTRSATIFSRGEGYYENRQYTEAQEWQRLPVELRSEVIDRTDRGVFSIEAIRKLSRSGKVRHRFFEVSGVDVRDNRIVIRSATGQAVECQMLVSALGFDPYWFTALLPEELRARLFALKRRKMNWKTVLERKIGADLSVPSEIIPAKLYLPMLAGLWQGPGIPNLSCLGTVSDLILERAPLLPTPERA